MIPCPRHVLDAARLLPALALALTALSGPAPALSPWLPADAVRAELVGRKLAGHYADGLKWIETYFADTRIEYWDAMRNDWRGNWSFRGEAFCTYYNDGANGGCWSVQKTSANCYEFFPSHMRADGTGGPPPAEVKWHARGWRTEEKTTCEAVPTV